MNPTNASFLSGAPQPRKRQNGQSLVLVVVMLTMLLAMTAFVVDLGFAYASYQKLQASADSAAIAAASVLPNWTLAQQYASTYSATTGNQNAIPGLTATMTVNYACSPALVTEFDLVCPTATGQIVHANAIQVVEQASVPTFFAKMLGFTTIPIKVTASARARGSAPVAANVVIVAQATGHTGGVADSHCPIANWPGGTIYQSDCIKAGIRTILSQLWPCPAGQTCSGSNPYDEVSLMIFPGLSSNPTGGGGLAASQAAEYKYTSPCETTGSITPYIDESYTTSSNGPNFTVVPLSTNYRTSATSTLLNGGVSPLVQAVDWSGDNGVPGNCVPSAYGYANIWETDYAPAITAAQAALAANSRPNTQNVIILVSDGDAPGQGGCNAGNNYCNGGGTAQCQQGVNAAAAAAHAGTTVFTIAYGANTNGTCSLDSGLQACTAMQDMAISPSTYPNPDPSKFYSDQGGQVGNCVSAANPSITSVTQIFQSIGVQLQTAALISNNTY